MILKTKISIVFFLLLPFGVFSQKVIKGVVLNAATLNPVEDVMVVAFDNNNFLKYTLSDKDGAFTLTVENLSRLRFSKLNYVKIEKEIKFDSNKNEQFIEVKLNPDKEAKILDEVVVKSKNYIYKPSDTTVFKAEAIRKESDVSIEDMIVRIPGISINILTGEIKYKNKSINKILLDGDDLTGNNYQIISKNLHQKVAEEIQIIEGYSDSEILKAVDKTNQTVINIKTDKKYQKRIKGNINTGYGHSNRYDVFSNLFYIGKTKVLSNISYNNIGKFSLGSVMSKSNLKNNLKRSPNLYTTEYSLVPITNNFNNVLINNRLDMTENNDFTLSENISYSNKIIRGKFNFGFYNNSFRKTEVTQTRFFDNDDAFLFSYVEKKSLKPKAFIFNTTQKFLLKNNLEMDFVFSLINKSDEVANVGFINENESKSESEISSNTSIFNFRMLKKTDFKNTFLFNTSIEYQKLNDLFIYNYLEDYFHPIFETILTKDDIILNKLNYRKYSSDTQLQYFYKINPNSVLSASIGYNVLNIDKDNTYSFKTNETLSLEKNDNGKRKLNNLYSDIKWSLFFKNGNLTTFLRLIHIKDYPSRFATTGYFQFKKRKGFYIYRLDLSRKIIAEDFYKNFDGILQRSVTGFFESGFSELPIYLNNKIELQVEYGNPRTNINLEVGLKGSYANLPYISSLNFNNSFFYDGFIKGENNITTYGLDFRFEKFFPSINHSFKVMPRFSYVDYDNIINNNLVNNQSLNTKIRITTRSAFDFFLNYYLGVNYNHSSFKVDEKGVVTRSNQSVLSGFVNFDAILLNEKMILRFDNVAYQYNNMSKPFYLSDFKISYKISNFQLALQVKNLFNNEEILKEFRSNNFYSQTTTSIIPRSFIFNLNYIF